MTTGELVWGAIEFFLLVAVAAMFITVFSEVLRRDDLSGWGKAGWTIVFLALPLLGILAYVIVRPKSAPSPRGGSASATAVFPSDRLPTAGMRP